MKTFLIQIEEDGTPSYDFCYGLMISKRYYEWSITGHGEFKYEYSTYGEKKVENPDDYIPVGSIEFVTKFVLANYGVEAVKQLKPFYPDCWLKNDRYLGGLEIGNPYHIATEMNASSNPNSLHVKSIERLKDENNGNYPYTYFRERYRIYDNEKWYVSKCIYPLSEWRVFVHDNFFMDMKCYKGDTWITPAKAAVMNMIEDYKDTYHYDRDMTGSYTLDVGVSPIDYSTKIIEFHEFYSCGLYGFDMYDRLPYMFSKQWAHVLRRIKGS